MPRVRNESESHCPTDKTAFPDPDSLLPTGFPKMIPSTKNECRHSCMEELGIAPTQKILS